MRRSAVLLLLALACQDPVRSDPLVKRAEFGIFYGGQVQERQRIGLVLDQTRQRQGLHLEFSRPLPEPTRVAWEIDMPRRDGKGRVTKIEEVIVPAGRDRLDQEIPFRPDDPFGTYNLRIIVAGALVLDRPYEVVDPRARPAPTRDAGR
jgi:hypothetical protein